MTFRIAWKPYMYNPTLPLLLGGVQTETLIVWGGRTGSCRSGWGAVRRALAKSRLSVVDGAGHFLEMEQPKRSRSSSCRSSARPDRGTAMHLMYFTEQPMSAYPATRGASEAPPR